MYKGAAMNTLDEEYKKGFALGIEGKEESELFLDNINLFRSDEEKRARQRGYEAGLKEKELRKRGIR
jgi:ribosome modulation factor